MTSMWTSNKPIKGLRHFVLLNKIKEKECEKNLMVSVVDAEINLEISNEELNNSDKWTKGWTFQKVNRLQKIIMNVNLLMI